MRVRVRVRVRSSARRSCPATVDGLAAEGGSRGEAFRPSRRVKKPGLAVALPG